MELTPTPSPVPIGDLLTATGQVVDKATDWMEAFANAITTNTLLILAVVAVPLVGLGVGLLARLLRKRV